jgi:hypothetical protein
MNVTTVFESLVPRLVDAIPRSVGAIGLTEPICCLRIYYYDTHAPCAYLVLRPVDESFRSKVLAEKGGDALYYLWASAEDMKGDAPEATLGDVEADSANRDLFRRIYDLLSEDEDRYMPIYRKALQKASYQLNLMDWRSVCRVTDDFVVAPADGSQCFADDYPDIAQSVPAARLELLRSRGLLGPGEEWGQRPGYPYHDPSRDLDVLEHGKSTQERIDYWIDQLDQMAAGKDCDMTRLGRNAHAPLERLGKMGTGMAVPLLKFACRWAEKPEWDCDDLKAAKEKPMVEVFYHLFVKVAELRHNDPSIELLLREFLTRSCRANEGRTLWGILPFRCAQCLHKLFDRYPEAKIAADNALENRADFQRIPLQ